MSQGSLTVSNLGKSYRRFNNEFGRILSWFGLPFKPKEEHWVLRNITFSIEPGRAVGIVGRNGAGKSTLLKLITGTIRPTEGSISFGGRIAAILELGMGFNQEFTGRQNVFHAAGLMGFKHSDIEQAMPEIEGFAEIGEYFDQPMRIYSSGMQMRVAFSVVTAFRPDILIIDEALSVGDTYFQHKSFSKIREFQKLGTTLLIVSHDKSAIVNLCDQAILLEKGKISRMGTPEEVMDYYNALIAEQEKSEVVVKSSVNGKSQTISGTGEAYVEEIGLFSNKGEKIESANVGDVIELIIKVRIRENIPKLILGYMIKDRLGEDIFGTNTYHTNQTLKDIFSGQIFYFKIQFSVNLGPGTYSISTALTSSDTHLENNYECRELATIFTVNNLNKNIFVGKAWIPPIVVIEKICN